MWFEDRMKALVVDLKGLRKGVGIQEAAMPSSVGVALRRACGVPDDVPPGVVRQRVTAVLAELIEQLPEGSRSAARVVFGFDNPDNAFYTARLARLGVIADRDTRTMQRRADAIVHLVAEKAVERKVATPLVAQETSAWHTRELRVQVLLRGPVAEVFETRRIVSHVPLLTSIKHAVSLATPVPVGPLDLAKLGIDEIEGCEVLEPRAVSAHRVAFTLKPPAPLGQGDEHSFFFRVRVPDTLPFYCCTPEYACERFTLSVGFYRDRPPARVWRINGELSMQANDPTPVRECLFPGEGGVVRTDFENLKPARSYGIGWEVNG